MQCRHKNGWIHNIEGTEYESDPYASLNYVVIDSDKTEFENMKIKMMNNDDEHLKRTYGDYMQLPPVEQRINHAPYIIEFGDVEK